MIHIGASDIVFDGETIHVNDLALGECDIRYRCPCAEEGKKACEPIYGQFFASEPTDGRCQCECEGARCPCERVEAHTDAEREMLAAIDWVRAAGIGAKAEPPDDVERGLRAWVARFKTS